MANAKLTGKQKKPLTIRERKFIKSLFAGNTATQAMRDAGYTESTSSVHQGKMLAKLRPTMEEICNLHGLSDEKLFKTLIEGLDSNKVISANVIAPSGEDMADAHGMTKDFIEVPDWQNRLKAVDIGFKVKSMYPADKHEFYGKGGGEIAMFSRVVFVHASKKNAD